ALAPRRPSTVAAESEHQRFAFAHHGAIDGHAHDEVGADLEIDPQEDAAAVRTISEGSDALLRDGRQVLAAQYHGHRDVRFGAVCDELVLDAPDELVRQL